MTRGLGGEEWMYGNYFKIRCGSFGKKEFLGCVVDGVLHKDGEVFKKNFSCADNIQAVTQLIERVSRVPPSLGSLFSWITRKAFDSVEVNAVLNALTRAGVLLPVYIHMLEQCFTNPSTNIQLFDRKMKIPFEKRSKTRRTSPKTVYGCAAVCYVYVDWEDKGYLINGKRINNLRFADDIFLVSTNTAERDDQRTQGEGLKIGLEMNMSKTQMMVNQRSDVEERNWQEELCKV
ncbi:hypothetical protein OSTOST_01432 [Ostertagia ostertagi]